MNIVRIPFFDIKEKKTYKEGDEYKGKRKDLDHLFKKSPKITKSTKEQEINQKKNWDAATLQAKKTNKKTKK